MEEDSLTEQTGGTSAPDIVVEYVKHSVSIGWRWGALVGPYVIATTLIGNDLGIINYLIALIRLYIQYIIFIPLTALAGGLIGLVWGAVVGWLVKSLVLRPVMPIEPLPNLLGCVSGVKILIGILMTVVLTALVYTLWNTPLGSGFLFLLPLVLGDRDINGRIKAWHLNQAQSLGGN